MASTQAYTNFTAEEFKAKYGTVLETSITQENAGLDDTTLTIEYVCGMITDYIEDNSPGFDKTAISAEQNTIINNAAMMQMRFMLAEADYSHSTGYNPLTGAKTDVPHYVSPDASRLLRRHIIYRGL